MHLFIYYLHVINLTNYYLLVKGNKQFSFFVKQYKNQIMSNKTHNKNQSNDKKQTTKN